MLAFASVRALRKSPGFTAVAVSILALGAPERLNGVRTTTNLFDVLGLQP